MLKKVTVALNKVEQKLIRKVATLQLESYRAILTGDTSEDILMYCIENEIAMQDLRDSVERDKLQFEHLITHPYNFPSLCEEHISIFKHILYNNFEQPKYIKCRKRISHILDLLEAHPINLN